MVIPSSLAALAHTIRDRRLDQQKSILIRLFSVVVFAWVITGCNAYLHFGSAPSPTPIATIAVSDDFRPEAAITFKVQIPPDSPPDEQIVISLLDEVTGLELNAQRHDMQAIDELHYEVELSVPVGSVIKYRYGRQNAFLVEEHTSVGIPVRYRLYRVDGPGIVEDVISAWRDTSFSGPSGRIMGKVTDSLTGRPIPNLMVTAGGSQALSASDGSFLIEALPPGVHNLVVYAMDGAYRTFQQGAEVAPESATIPTIQVVGVPQIPITFEVKVPEDTLQGIPLRLAGNLSQLGNTFADLTGGTSVIPSRMPEIYPDSDGQYRLTINLPAGADLAYKYTLGDGFWNAEYSSSAELRVRHLIIPEKPLTLADQIDSWGTGFNLGPVIFDVAVPMTTPLTDQVSIQFNAFGWTEPVPMWRLGDQRWAFMLYNPGQSGNAITYRYCRNDQCGSADDSLTPGPQNPGRVIEVTENSQTVNDKIESWAWLTDEDQDHRISTEVIPRKSGFVGGVEFQPDFHPSWISFDPYTLTDIHSLGANWLVVTPSWSFTHSSPVVLEPVLGIDPTWQDTSETIAQAGSQGFQTAVFPTPHFPDGASEWWNSAPRGFAWWLVWFERYRSFIIHHADLAQESGAQALILGGDWIGPALPRGFLADGAPSNVPADSQRLWEELVAEVRDHFQGELVWALAASPDILTEYPSFISSFDKLYLLWSLPLASQGPFEPEQLTQVAGAYLDNQVQPLISRMNKPIILGLSYPSAAGGIVGCVPDPDSEEEPGCLDLERLSRPEPDIPEVALDLEEQYLAYEAVFGAINARDWIDGVIARGYYPPVALQDKSISLHGKQVENLLKYWFPFWVNLSGTE